MTTQPAIKYPTTAQETVIKWMYDGATRNEAIYQWESIMRMKLPEVIRNLIPWEV